MSYVHGAFTIFVLSVIWSIYRLHRNPDVEFNFLDLLIENNRVSKVSCLVMGAFSLHSWIMADLQIQGKMTEGYMTTYGVTWVAPLLMRLLNINPSKADDDKRRTDQ